MKGLPTDLPFPRRAVLLPSALFDARAEFCGLMGEREAGPVARVAPVDPPARRPFRSRTPRATTPAPLVSTIGG
ncbi:MAG TPA: hypothetical protein VHB21_22045 [Minicystis sp.]|nr:hypothetical protein [Minicystis sp.]